MADVASDSDVEDASTSSSSQFDPEDWIGKGRTAPAPATGLALHVASLAEIPSDVSHRCMPGEGLTIDAFLQHVLPVRTYRVVQVQVKECFSRMPPNDDATYYARLSDLAISKARQKSGQRIRPGRSRWNGISR